MRNKWIYTMFVLVLSLFAACSDRSDDQPADKGKTRTVVFRLSVDDAVGSRAAWSDAYKSGDADVPFDTRINMNELQIVVYTTNNNYIGKAKNVFSWPVSGGENDNGVVEYELVGDLSHITAMEEGLSYKFMVLANCPTVPENGSLENMVYSIEDIAYNTGYIPMWGVETITLTEDENQDLGTIDLLRAVAKVEVIIGDGVSEAITDVKLTRYNRMGYCLPRDYSDVSHTAALDREVESMHEYRLINTDDGKDFEGNDKKFFIYVPEYDNQLPANEYTSIALKVGGVDYTIQFTSYENGVSKGERFDLVRNHIYRYTITDVKTSGQLVLNYKVADWVKGDNWELNFSYPTYVNPVMPYENIDENENNNLSGPWNPIMEFVSDYDESKAFSCWFQITGPSGQQWTPVLQTGNNLAEIKVYKDDVLVYDSSNSENYLVTNLVAAPNKWYNIKVIPNGAFNAEEPQIVEFGITYTPSFDPNGGARYLLINGEGGNHYWLHPGDDGNFDPRLIRIHQIQSSSSGGENTGSN